LNRPDHASTAVWRAHEEERARLRERVLHPLPQRRGPKVRACQCGAVAGRASLDHIVDAPGSKAHPLTNGDADGAR
jgi:hypothetical protein